MKHTWRSLGTQIKILLKILKHEGFKTLNTNESRILIIWNMFKTWYLYNNLYMGWFKLVSMVKKVNMFKKKCSVCIFLIYNGSKPKHFLLDIYSTTVELMAINGCISISRFVPFFVRVLLLTLLRSELIISILCDVAYPWESLVSTLFNDLQISHLKKII